MDSERISKYTFMVVLLIMLYIAIIVIKPFLTYFVLALILAFIFKKPYHWLYKLSRSKTLSAGLSIIIILCIIIIPSFFIVTSLAEQGSKAVNALTIFFEKEVLSTQLGKLFGPNLNVEPYVANLFIRTKQYIVNEGPKLISSVGTVLLGIFVMFFITYYLLKGGEALTNELKELIPLKKKYKSKLFYEIETVMHGILYGTLLCALIQGALGGIGFFIVGLPNPIFWGFIMAILAFLPVVGTPMVWVPGALYLLAVNKVGGAIFLFIYGLVLVANIDKFIMPRLIGHKVKLHPAVILVGVLGGLKVFGFIGFILGPVILAVLLVLIRSYVSDYQSIED